VARAAHHLIGDPNRVHDIEGEQRDVRRLEHVAAGVEHEIRQRVRGGHRDGFLPEPLQEHIVELQAGYVVHVARDLAEILHPVPAPVALRVIVPRHGDARHVQEEARIDAVVARLDAFPAQHAGVRPLARRLRPLPMPQDIDDPVDDRSRLGVHAAGARHRADLHALAAARAGIEHGVDAA
jgi:hypothetical protein